MTWNEKQSLTEIGETYLKQSRFAWSPTLSPAATQFIISAGVLFWIFFSSLFSLDSFSSITILTKKVPQKCNERKAIGR